MVQSNLHRNLNRKYVCNLFVVRRFDFETILSCRSPKKKESSKLQVTFFLIVRRGPIFIEV